MHLSLPHFPVATGIKHKHGSRRNLGAGKRSPAPVTDCLCRNSVLAKCSPDCSPKSHNLLAEGRSLSRSLNFGDEGHELKCHVGSCLTIDLVAAKCCISLVSVL